MKRFYFLAASIGLLAACSGLEQPEQDLFMNNGEDLVEKVIFEVLPVKDGDDPETKASAVPNGGTVGFVWEATDTVGIYPDKGSQVYFNIEDGVGTSSVSFTGGGWALKQNSTYTSYYPFVGDIYLKRDKIPVSFAGQKQIGTTSPFVGARYYLATEASTSEHGVLRFSYSTLNTIINVNATLPAGTYTKMSLTIEEPLFIEEGTYSLDEREIVGTKFTNTLEIELEDVVLTEEATIPVYIMSAPVDLKGKEVIVRFMTDDDTIYRCIKPVSKTYLAGTRYGLTCNQMERESQPKNIIYYTSRNGSIVTPSERADFGANIVSNEYIDGRGVISFDGDVTCIGDSSFWDCNTLTSISIPNSVTRIGFAAFFHSGLVSIEIPSSVISIGIDAFDCYNLAAISVDSSNPKYDSRDNCNAIIETESNTLISGCKNTIIPDSVTSIGDAAFHWHNGLTSIEIPNSITSIGDRAFEACYSLTSIEIPSSITSIGECAFGGCRRVESIVVDPGNRNYDSRNDCNAIIETNSNSLVAGCKNSIVPDSVLSIGDYAFCNCYFLASISIPDSVKSFGDYAFYGCHSLTSFIIPDSVTSIGTFAFYECTALTSIRIPESVKNLGDLVFGNCSSLSSVEIPNSITSLGYAVFRGCTNLSSITIPESMTSIGQNAFSDCSSLTSIVIPASVASIGYQAFSNCSNLTSIIVQAQTPPRGESQMFHETNNCPIYIPAESLNAYKTARYWSEYADRFSSMEGGDVPPSEDGGDD